MKINIDRQQHYQDNMFRNQPETSFQIRVPLYRRQFSGFHTKVRRQNNIWYESCRTKNKIEKNKPRKTWQKNTRRLQKLVLAWFMNFSTDNRCRSSTVATKDWDLYSGKLSHFVFESIRDAFVNTKLSIKFLEHKFVVKNVCNGSY